MKSNCNDFKIFTILWSRSSGAHENQRASRDARNVLTGKRWRKMNKNLVENINSTQFELLNHEY